MELQVSMKRIYGQERFYPHNESAKMICKLLTSLTITKDQLKTCRDGGCEIKIITEEYELD